MAINKFDTVNAFAEILPCCHSKIGFDDGSWHQQWRSPRVAGLFFGEYQKRQGIEDRADTLAVIGVKAALRADNYRLIGLEIGAIFEMPCNFLEFSAFFLQFIPSLARATVTRFCLSMLVVA